jgi:uncharacterized repeat protein (TIGR03803 family)
MHLVSKLALTLGASLISAFAAAAPTSKVALKTLHTFGTPVTGDNPSGVIQGNDGNLYGLNTEGGSAGLGTIFRMTPGGKVTVLHSFTGGDDGSNPQSLLVQAADGTFYGTTNSGGTGWGVVFHMTADGTVTSLHTFSGQADGGLPQGSLIQGSDGNLYGTTVFGGDTLHCNIYFLGCGIVFKITPDGVLTTLHTFSKDSASPHAGLVQGRDGNLYGTTSSDITGSTGGSVFRITPDGRYTELYKMSATDGLLPTAALLQGSDGDFYGTAFAGGAYGYGTLFKVSRDGAFTLLHTFACGDDGGAPSSGLALDRLTGAVIGNTSLCNSGAAASGSVFKVSKSGEFSTIYYFDGTAGVSPNSLVHSLSGIGTYYGSTIVDATTDGGTVFRLTVLP